MESKCKIKHTFLFIFVFILTVILSLGLSKRYFGKQNRMIINKEEPNIEALYSALTDELIISDEIEFVLSNGTRGSLSDLLPDKCRFLVVRTIRSNCSSCLVHVRNILSKHKELFQKTIMLTDYEDPNVLNFYEKADRYAPLCIGSFGLYLPADKLNKPYLFVMDTCYRIHSVYFPNINHDSLLEQYLGEIEGRILL